MATGKWRAFRKVLQRKKRIEPDEVEISSLRRCLTYWDLTSLGLGSTLGVGVYVLVGSVALRVAGPSIVLSFLIAAVASMFAGLCYAEFGSRVPKAGSAYIYTYVTVGEFAAFIIGWNMILEALFGTASVARGLSTYVDSMTSGSISEWFTSVAPISAGFFSAYFDFLAFFIVIMLGVLLAVGARESSMVNNVFAMMNMSVILFMIIVGAITAKSANWSIPQEEVPAGSGVGGFFPYGIWGMLRGAALCFYGFVGFDAISATGEEVTEPRKTIPQAILTVLCVVLLVYVSVSTVVTMMVPYYALDKVAAVATAFTYVGWDWARWVVSVGAVFGICASLYGAMFPLPRLLYSMAGDGLLLHWFGHVSSSSQTPIVATVVPACVIATLAAIVDLDQLIIMMCIGTLLSYTIVAACVVLLRYKSKLKKEIKPSLAKQIFGLGDRSPSQTSSRIATVALLLFILICITTALVGINLERPVIPVVILHVVALVLLVAIMVQPQAQEQLSFKTPLVPVVPCLSIYFNIHLMILVNLQTWIRVIVWILIGIPIYSLCLYCYKRNRVNQDSTMKQFDHSAKNGKSPVQIVIETPTPTNTLRRGSNISRDQSNMSGDQIHVINEDDVIKRSDDFAPRSDNINIAVLAQKFDDIIVEESIVENNEEKEAKIIDLLDQVLQAEEDSYIEQISLKDMKVEDETIMVPISDPIPHRKSLSELSDAGSDASMGNLGLSKYNVIAQVHREDFPKLNEEEEGVNNENQEHELNPEDLTEVENSETNSRTDESGYSDTLDKNALNDSLEDTTEDVPYIPPPPPPPPLDERLYNNPYLIRKSYTIPIPTSRQTIEKQEEGEKNKPRASVQSSNSQDDDTMVFGSSRQMKFMNKLNNIFQTKIATEPNEEQEMKRSNSTGSIMENSELKDSLWREQPSILNNLELKKEMIARNSVPNLKPVNLNVKENKIDIIRPNAEEPEEDASMSRDNLKSKLENIFANGGGMLQKPRLMKSNPPTPEESYITDTSSSESIPKLPKMEKNDTLKRQKDRFGAVLNSFRLSLNKDDAV